MFALLGGLQTSTMGSSHLCICLLLQPAEQKNTTDLERAALIEPNVRFRFRR